MSLQRAVFSLFVYFIFCTFRPILIMLLSKLLNFFQRHGEKLHYSWPNILQMLRFVFNLNLLLLITRAFNSILFIF